MSVCDGRLGWVMVWVGRFGCGVVGLLCGVGGIESWRDVFGFFSKGWGVRVIVG